ncbi:lipopolysaccharide biosynthesis protein [Hoeflea sp.]|uniref:lipopolysaccharide biosynthesis protein n=1 Tax=Hoeflea sp. TaxID=1940281 RepID=UPI001982B9B5|nr:lipopolysaccharide biosynthesis protein [Hoeflea sp.]MBC7286020.1 lipopolysaccharide biosynthesis protein [Hoeflea sp.]
MNKVSVNPSLASRSFSGLAWVSSGSAISSVLKIGVVAVLARLVTPEQFGVVSAVLVVSAFADVFGQLGVAPALVQKDEVTAEDVATGLAVSLIFGLILGAGVFLGAPWIAGLFGSSELVQPLKVVSLIFPLQALGLVSSALIQRNLGFRSLSLVDLGSYVFGYSAVAVLLAFFGLGYWSIIFGHLAQTILASIGYIVCNPHPFRVWIYGASIKELFRFGSGLTLGKLGNYVARNVDYLVVSRTLGQEALGFYSRAFYLMQQPTRLIGSVGDRVLFPLFASIKRERERLARVFYICTLVVFLVTSFAAAQIFVLAADLVRILLGDQWGAVVEPIKLLALSLPFRIAWKSAATMIRSQGSTFQLAAWQWSYAFMVLGAALLGSEYGINGVAFLVSVVILINYIACLLLLKTKYPISLMHDFAIIVKCCIMGMMSGLVTEFLIDIPLIWQGGPVLRLATGCIVGGTGLLLALLLIDRIFPGDGEWIRSRVLKALPLRSRVPSG